MNSNCVFYRKDDSVESCAYTNKKKCCFICLDFMVPISDLKADEHFNLNENRRGRFLTLTSLIISALFSTIALIVSVLTFLYKN